MDSADLDDLLQGEFSTMSLVLQKKYGGVGVALLTLRNETTLLGSVALKMQAQLRISVTLLTLFHHSLKHAQFQNRQKRKPQETH